MESSDLKTNLHPQYPILKQESDSEAMAEDKLIKRLHALPPELFDVVYDNVFTAGTSRKRITDKHGPPKLLSIDHGSREKYAESYFGGRTFKFVLEKEGISLLHKSRLIKWLAALPQHHLEMLRDVRVYVRYPNVKISPEEFKEHRWGWHMDFRIYRMFLMATLEEMNLGQIRRVLSVEGRVKINDGVIWALFGCDVNIVTGPCDCRPLPRANERKEGTEEVPESHGEATI